MSQYNITPQPTYNPKLQYNFPATAHPLQLCHDTIFHCIVTQLGSNPTNSAPFFFSFFTHFFSSFLLLETPKKYIYIFFHSPIHPIKFKINFVSFTFLHACHWKNTKKKKLIHIIFFSFSSTLNKFIKIYFHSFFFRFTPCKTLENNFHHLVFFFFHFPITQINLLKFILFIFFFPVLHTVKLQTFSNPSMC